MIKYIGGEISGYFFGIHCNILSTVTLDKCLVVITTKDRALFQVRRKSYPYKPSLIHETSTKYALDVPQKLQKHYKRSSLITLFEPIR